mgnify:CR=1 FL=1
MHILFFSDNFPPEVNAPASRTFEHCREWVGAGHKVTVITCAPNFPKGKVFAGYRNRLWSREYVSGIEVIRVWSYITRNEGFAKRILDYLSYMVAASIAALFVRRIDLIVGTSPQFFTVCASYFAATVKRRPWVFEVRDIWPESIRAVGALHQSRLLDLFEKLELFLYRKASSVVTVTHAIKENLIARKIESTKIHVVTNGVDAQRFIPMTKDAQLEVSLGLEGKFVAGYIGTHGLAHGLDTLIDAAHLLAENDDRDVFRILMIGDGAARSHLEARAYTEGVSNIIFLESVAKNEVVRYWSLLDTSIIHLKKVDLFKGAIPSKLFECMAMGIPVLHGVEGESADIVTRSDIGLTFEPENAKMLAEMIVSLHSNPSLRDRLKRNGPKAAMQFDRTVLASNMLEVLDEAATQNTT